MKYTLKYYYIEEADILVSTLEEDSNYSAKLVNNEWEFWGISLDQLKKEFILSEISFDDAFIIMFGNFPHRLYKSIGKEIYEEEPKPIEDILEHFLDNFKEFAIDDFYKEFHNKNKDLIYSAKEMDIHYENSGHYEMIEKYFEEFIKRKKENEFSFVDIEKTENDFIIKFGKEILEDK